MTRRYLFLCPDVTSPSGGVAVIYDMVELLVRLGHDAAVVHESAHGAYINNNVVVPTFYCTRMKRRLIRSSGIRGRIKHAIRSLSVVPKGNGLPLLEERDTDIVITPEFCMDTALEAFGHLSIGVFVQNPFSLLRAFCRARDRGMDPLRNVAMWLSIAEVCDRTLEMLGARNIHRFPVSMKPHLFDATTPKKRLITYMPRKRPVDAQVIVHALATRQKIGDHEVRALHNLPPAEIRKALSESRIFISLLKDEALGFPAAEAMAARCVVIGFDGLGCEEYFDETTGIPVKEGDVARLVVEVERVAKELDIDPTRYDGMTARASRLVRERYGTDAFEARVASLWKSLCPGPTRADSDHSGS